MRALIAVLLCGLAAGCTTKAGGRQAGEAQAPATSASIAMASQAAPTLVKPEREVLDGADDFRSALRALDWPLASESYQRLTPELSQRPELRYARAYCAERLGDAPGVLSVSTGLDSELPLLAPEVARLRAKAAFETGDYKAAAAYFTKGQGAEDLLWAARTKRAAGELDAARTLIDRSLSLASTQPSAPELQVEIRAERARITSEKGQKALLALDLRWLALSAPTSELALDADERLETIGGQALTKQERYERALAFGEQGKISEVDAELALLSKAKGVVIPEAELLHARAWAHYSARNYAESAALFDRAVSGGTKFKLKDSFYAARALSRADRDREAIERYRKFVLSYPQAALAEDARYNIGRLYYILGDWEQAALAYNKYLGAFSKRGRFTKSARYELAVTRLAQREYDKALTGFSALLKDESSPRLQARYRLLEAVALMGAKNQPAAVQKLRQLALDAPLSFPSLAARRRLVELGETPPPHLPEPEALAAQAPLALELPDKVRLLADAGLDYLAEAELATHEPELKAKYRPREYESLCLAYSSLTGAARRYQVGQQAARWSLLTKSPNPQSRWLWDCVYPTPYPDAVAGAESEFQLPQHLIHAVMRQESGFRPEVVSPAKAVGLMQLIPPTAERVASGLGVEYEPEHLRVPRYSVRFGAYYLRRLLDSFGNNLVLAAAAYNAGPRAVSHWLESGEALDLDVFVARIPYGETRSYVEHVIENLGRYAYLAGGNAAVPELDLRIQPGLRVGPDAY